MVSSRSTKAGLFWILGPVSPGLGGREGGARWRLTHTQLELSVRGSSDTAESWLTRDWEDEERRRAGKE